MNAGLSSAGLRLEQAPPLAVPVSFFLGAPLALLVAGALLAAGGASLLVTRFSGATVALVHLGTLGFLASVMLGALYQMIPVVAGAPVPLVRLAHAVHAGLLAGVALLVGGLVESSRSAVVAGASLLGLTLLSFLVPVTIALVRAPAKSATVAGMRVAVAALVVTLALGIAMAGVRGSGAPAPRYSGWLAAHLSLGLIVWIGGLITAVSFQVLPMFYLTPGLGRRVEALMVGAIGLTLIGLSGAALVGASPDGVVVAALPGALTVWFAHPLLSLRAIAQRRRKRTDPSLDFWRVALLAALALGPLGALAVHADDTRFPVLFGWVLLWGWAAMIVHGMLMRIVPFLVWFHRFSWRVGKEHVPTMKQLLPERFARVGFALQLATLALGVIAIVTGASVVARLTGAGIGLTGVALAVSLLRALRVR